jgi:hypothetical protein
MRVTAKHSAMLIVAFGLAVCSTGLSRAVQAEGSKAKKPKAELAEKQSKEAPKPLIRDDLLLLPDAEPDMGEPPLTVHFTGEIYDEDVVKAQFTWSFGDGSSESHQRNPTHTYKEPGVYKVNLYVVDYWRRKGTEEMTIVVNTPPEE